jgi:hypothetical protein
VLAGSSATQGGLRTPRASGCQSCAYQGVKPDVAGRYELKGESSQLAKAAKGAASRGEPRQASTSGLEFGYAADETRHGLLESAHSVEADANTFLTVAQKAYEDAAKIIGLIEILEASNIGNVNPSLNAAGAGAVAEVTGARSRCDKNCWNSADICEKDANNIEDHMTVG